MQPPSTKPEELPNTAQLLLMQFVFGKMREFPSTSEGVRAMKEANVPTIPTWWFAWDFLYEPAWKTFGLNWDEKLGTWVRPENLPDEFFIA